MPVPPEVPIVKFFSPNKADRGLIEFHNTSVADYVPLDLGVAHPNTREYPSYKLGKQFNLPNDEKWVVRIWVTDQVDPTWWAWSEKFSAESNSHPIFIREYREPRKTYAPLTKGLPLKSVYKLTLSTAGSGYEPGTLPALTFDNTGTSGTGAAGHAVVNPDGTIAHLVLDDGGDNYASAPTFTIAAPPAGGTTATGTAAIQPATALLVAEEAQRFPEDSEFHGLYLQVVRVYETLPGPTIPYTRFDDDLGPVQGTRQAVLWNNQAAAITATDKTTYEARDGSSIVAWKVVESWSDGTGGAGNPAYPILKTDFNDPERGPIHQVSQITTDTTSAGSSSASGGTVTTIRYEPYQDNPNLRKKIIETWAVPRTLAGEELTTQYGGDVLTVTTTRDDEGQSADEGLGVVASVVEAIGDGTSRKVTKQASDAWPTLIGSEFDSRFGILFSTEKSVVAAGTTGSVGELTVTEVQPLDKWRSIQVVGRVPELPDAQVWYGTRNHSFPDELLDFALVGTEEMSVEFNIRDGYSGPVRARFTRSFSYGPPTDQPAPTIFLPQAFYKYIEYSASRSSTNTSSSTSSGTSDHSATNQSTNQSSGTHSSSSQSESESTSSGTNSHSETSESEGTDSGSSSASNTSQSSHSSQGTSDTNSTGASSSEFQSETSSNTHTSQSPDEILVDSNSWGNSQGTNDSQQTSQSSSEGTSDNSSESSGSHESSSQSNRSGSGESTSSGTSQNTTSGTSSGTSQSNTDSSGTSSGTSQSTNTNEGTSETTSIGISSLRITIPKTLRPAMSSTNLGITVEIPATTPTALPHGDWIVVDSTSDHWRFGVWVTELIEILVPVP